MMKEKEATKAKKPEIRQVSKPEIAAYIDAGHKISLDVDAKQKEDKEYRKTITGHGLAELQSGETSVRLMGVESAALVTRVEDMAVNTTRKAYKETVEDAINRGLLEGVIEKKMTVKVAPTAIEKLRKLLGADFDEICTVTTSLEVSEANLRDFYEQSKTDAEKKELAKAVKECVEKSVSTRVKYTAIEKE